jgi:drug/metabolite transporter (DMT)-like permease
MSRVAGLDPLLASCLWGGMYVVSRAGFGLIPPVTLGALRVIIGGAALTLALWLAARRNPKLAATSPARPTWTARDRSRAIALGGIVAATIITQFLGTALASAHDGALLTTITPVFVVLLAWLLLGERPRWAVVVGMLLALVGVAIVVAAQTAGESGTGSASHETALLGDGMLLLSALCWALFTVVGAPLIRKHSALVAATSATRWSLLFMLPAAAIELALRDDWRALSFSPGAVGAVLYLGLGATALAWFLWYRGIAHMEAGVASIYFFAQPVVGGILAGVFLHEALPVAFWLGGAVLASGILVVAWLPARDSSSINDI